MIVAYELTKYIASNILVNHIQKTNGKEWKLKIEPCYGFVNLIVIIFTCNRIADASSMKLKINISRIFL